MAEKGTALQNTVLACGVPFSVKWESSNSNGGSEANRELKVIYLDEESSKQSDSSNIQRDMNDRRIDSQMNIFGLDESSAKRGSYKEFSSNSYGQVPASADMSHQHIDIGTIYNGIQPMQPLPVGGVEVEQVENIKNIGSSNGLVQDKCSIPVSDSEMQEKLSRRIMNMNGQEMRLDQTQKGQSIILAPKSATSQMKLNSCKSDAINPQFNMNEIGNSRNVANIDGGMVPRQEIKIISPGSEQPIHTVIDQFKLNTNQFINEQENKPSNQQEKSNLIFERINTNNINNQYQQQLNINYIQDQQDQKNIEQQNSKQNENIEILSYLLKFQDNTIINNQQQKNQSIQQDDQLFIQFEQDQNQQFNNKSINYKQTAKQLDENAKENEIDKQIQIDSKEENKKEKYDK